MFTKTLFSVNTLVDYLLPLSQDPGTQKVVTIYGNMTGLGELQHVLGANQKEIDSSYHGPGGDLMSGIINLGVFTFYNEFAPYTRAAVERMVKHHRQS